MCEKCVEIDEKVARYRALSARLLDRPIVERIKAFVADLLALKLQYYPEQE
jgi:hypothetical protein